MWLSSENKVQFFSGVIFQVGVLGFGFQSAGFHVLVFFVLWCFLRWHGFGFNLPGFRNRLVFLCQRFCSSLVLIGQVRFFLQSRFFVWLGSQNRFVFFLQSLLLKIKFVFFSKRFGSHNVFGLWSKSTLRVKFSQVGSGFGFYPAFWSASRLPNKACSGRVGVCAIYRHFSGFGFFLLPSRIHARPPAANASRWVLALTTLRFSGDYLHGIHSTIHSPYDCSS